MQLLTFSTEHSTLFWVETELFNASLYEEIFFESMPQVILQLLNYHHLYLVLTHSLTYSLTHLLTPVEKGGGSIWQTNLTLFISTVSGIVIISMNIVSFLRVKYEGKRFIDCKTGTLIHFNLTYSHFLIHRLIICVGFEELLLSGGNLKVTFCAPDDDDDDKLEPDYTIVTGGIDDDDKMATKMVKFS